MFHRKYIYLQNMSCSIFFSTTGFGGFAGCFRLMENWQQPLEFPGTFTVPSRFVFLEAILQELFFPMSIPKKSWSAAKQLQKKDRCASPIPEPSVPAFPMPCKNPQEIAGLIQWIIQVLAKGGSTKSPKLAVDTAKKTMQVYPSGELYNPYHKITRTRKFSDLLRHHGG